MNSALPNGSPVSLDQFLSRNGSLGSPFRNRLCVVGRSQESPGPSGPVVDWLAARGETSISDRANNAVPIMTLDLGAVPDMSHAEGYGVQTQRLPVPRVAGCLPWPLMSLQSMLLVSSRYAFPGNRHSPEELPKESLFDNRTNLLLRQWR